MARLEKGQANACFLGLEKGVWGSSVLPPLTGIARIKSIESGNRVDPDGSKGGYSLIILASFGKREPFNLCFTPESEGDLTYRKGSVDMGHFGFFLRVEVTRLVQLRVSHWGESVPEDPKLV